MKALIAEDDARTRAGLRDLLETEGYTVICAADGEEALRLYHEEGPDVLCLDVMMPAADGYSVCRRIRENDPETPILFISAKAEEIDRIAGLELGADDYIAKPFGVREVAARVRAVTRRALAQRRTERGPETWRLGRWTVSPDALRARDGETTVDLSLREVRLLEEFYRNPGRALDRAHLFRTCWGLDFLPNSRTLDQHIARLRKRLERDPRQPELLKTVHGVGYRYDGGDGDADG